MCTALDGHDRGRNICVRHGARWVARPALTRKTPRVLAEHFALALTDLTYLPVYLDRYADVMIGAGQVRRLVGGSPDDTLAALLLTQDRLSARAMRLGCISSSSVLEDEVGTASRCEPGANSLQYATQVLAWQRLRWSCRLVPCSAFP
jgi:hypothetical protein